MVKKLYRDTKKEYLALKEKNDDDLILKAIKEAELIAYWRVLTQVFNVKIDIEKILY